MRTSLLAVPLLALVVVGCSATDNFRSETERFLNDDSRVEADRGGDVDNATCEEPSSAEVGTRYECTADVDGVTQGFDVEIVEEDGYVVTPQVDPPVADG